MNNIIYVGNLPSGIEENKLRFLFRNCDKIISIKVFNHPGPEWNGNYSYIEMNSELDANNAIIELNGYSITGRRIIAVPFIADDI
jgi:RNA recognition motif-containing protein